MIKNRKTLLTILLVVGCVTVGESGRKRLAPLPDSYMNALGSNTYQELKKETKVSTNKALTAKVMEVGDRIAKASGQSYAWEFTLFDSPEVNAFCLPGGKVGIYTGILKVAQSNAGLAAIIGHEVAHATARHGGERLSQQLLVSGALIAADEAFRDSKYKGLILGALGVGSKFGILLPYSRLQESEADQIGTNYMAKAGYDPKEAVKVWHRMAALNGGKVPEFLSTHPDSLKRANDIERELSESLAIYNQSNKIQTVPID